MSTIKKYQNTMEEIMLDLRFLRGLDEKMFVYVGIF